MTSMPYLSVVVPCYNEQESIFELCRRVRKVCDGVAPGNYEIVLINDGSRDLTWTLILKLKELNPEIVGVNLTRNHGHQLALTAGLSVCQGERILVLDADLQDPPELLPDMLRLMDQGADVVYGERRERLGESWFKRTSASAFYRLLNALVDVKIPEDTGDFRLMSRRVLDILNDMPEHQRFIRGLISWIGFEQVAIQYERHERFAGTTNYPFGKMLNLAIDGITSFSTKPLRVASYLGTIFGLAALTGVMFTVYSWLAGNTIPGWSSVMVAIMIMGSVQLLMLGLIGEYLGRLYMGSKGRPLFLIDQIVRTGPDAMPSSTMTIAQGYKDAS